MTDLGRLGAFITKVKKGSLADVVGHLRAGNVSILNTYTVRIFCMSWWFLIWIYIFIIK